MFRSNGRSRALSLSAVCVALLSTSAFAQDEPTPGPQPGQPPTPGAGRGGAFPGGFGQGRPGATSRPRPYGDVITSSAKTDEGLITTHQIDDRVYFEIPTAVLGKEILWVTTLRETQVGAGYGGQEVQDRVVRWEKRGDKILLRGVDYQARAAEGSGLDTSVRLSAVEPILQVFNVAAYNDKKDNAAVIEITPFLNSDPSEFSARTLLGGARLDTNRTFIERVKSLPQNVELDILATYAAAPPQAGGRGGPGGPAPGPRPRRDGPQRDRGTDAITAVVHHSLVILPEKPMLPRLSDERVGYFLTGFYEFGNKENRVKRVSYISRWRLEKKDPKAAISEPVKPITYYIGPEVPKKWWPYIKKGVEDWQPAFEKAGFKNGIVCKFPPSKEEDPDFDPDDVRYSVIRWFPSATENAYGPSIKDPRSGEILNANPRFYHNVLKLSETWYFTQASPNDKRAQKLPLPEDLTGELLRYVVSHEIGHTLGLRHNMKGSSSISIAQLRDPKFTGEWGTEASIMDYGRFNYVAQPEDKVTRLIPKIGPYDLFAIDWGYREIGAPTSEAEKTTLNLLASQQSKNAMLRFGGGPEGGITVDDPTQQTEDLGSDSVEATRLGLKNIDRVMGYLVSATSKPGEDYELLDETYDAVIGQRERELGHVMTVIGGFVQTSTFYNQTGAASPANYTPIPAAKQRAAMQLLLTNVLQTPKSLIQPDILNRIEPSGVSDRILASQTRMLGRLLADSRIKRMVDTEAIYGTANVYPVAEMMGDLTRGAWSELYVKSMAPLVIDSYRRNLQRAYIDLLGEKLNGPSAPPAAAAPAFGPPAASGPPNTDVRPLARGALMDIQTVCKASLPRAKDRMTRLHLMDCIAEVDRILDPKK